MSKFRAKKKHRVKFRQKKLLEHGEPPPPDQRVFRTTTAAAGRRYFTGKRGREFSLVGHPFNDDLMNAIMLMTVRNRMIDKYHYMGSSCIVAKLERCGQRKMGNGFGSISLKK